jgi:glycosyltransferase involved in cell wall biosynthesis
VYNEEELLATNTARLLGFLKTRFAGVPFEFLIGSNGSTDRTVALAREISEKDPRVRVFHLPEKGVGAAFREGVRQARYDRFLTVDMDLSIDLEFLPQAYALLATCDMVVGSKITGEQKRPFLRKFVSNLFIRLARILLGIDQTDYSIAAKAYRTDTVERHLGRVDDLTFYVVQVVYHLTREGRSVVEVPVDCHDMRESRFNLVHEGFYKFGNLFLLWARQAQGRAGRER